MAMRFFGQRWPELSLVQGFFVFVEFIIIHNMMPSHWRMISWSLIGPLWTHWFSKTFFAEKSESGDGKKSFSREHKIEILKLLASDVIIDGLRRPLSIAMTMTSSSLAACFLEKEKRISFPTFD